MQPTAGAPWSSDNLAEKVISGSQAEPDRGIFSRVAAEIHARISCILDITVPCP